MSSKETNITDDILNLLNEAEDYFNSKKDKFEADEKIRKKLSRLNTVFAIGLIPASIALAFTETSFSIPIAAAAILSIILLIVILTFIGEGYKKNLLPGDFVHDYYLYKSYVLTGKYLNSNNAADLDTALKFFRKFCYPSEESTEIEKEKFFKSITLLSETNRWFKVTPETSRLLEVFGSVFSKIEYYLSQKSNIQTVQDISGNILILVYLDFNGMAETPQYDNVINTIIELDKSFEPIDNRDNIQSSNKSKWNFFKSTLGSGSLQKRIVSWFIFSLLLTLIVKLIFIILNEEITLNDLIFNVFVLAFTDGLAVSYLAPVVFGKRSEN